MNSSKKVKHNYKGAAMKNIHRFFAIFVLVVIITGMVCYDAFADDITIVLNGRRVNLDTPPIRQSGMVFVPLRGVFERMGASVDYNKNQNRITSTRGSKAIALRIGDEYAVVNGSRRKILFAPFVQDNRVYVPLRFLSESMGCEVNWHPPSSTVSITSKVEKKSSAESSNLQKQMDQINKFMQSTEPTKNKQDDRAIKTNIKKVKPIDKKSPSPSNKPSKSKSEEGDLKMDDIDIDDIKIED